MSLSKVSTRYRNLTEAAQQEYEKKVDRFLRQLGDLKSELTECFSEVERCQSDIDVLKSLDILLDKGFASYENVSKDFCDYLISTRSHSSENELASHHLVKETLAAKLNVTKSKINQYIKQETTKASGSQGSCKSLTQRSYASSRSSSRASLDSTIRRKEAKLQAQQVMLDHLDEELELEAQLKHFRAQRDMRVVQSELNILKEERSVVDLPPSQSSKVRTEEYIALLPNYEAERREIEDFSHPANSVNIKKEPFSVHSALSRPDSSLFGKSPEPFTPKQHSFTKAKSTLNPEVKPFVPQPSAPIQIDTFTNHLVEKDLILTRLTQFDDDPLMYVSWKMGFLGIMKELDATEMEQLQLLCEKLGPDSSRQAKIIRACNANDPSTAINKIWERLERRFGSAEHIEDHILNKIKAFPSITSDRFGLLYDLADLASEVASLKAQPQFDLMFSYFDSKKGVNEFVEKLPYNLQEKWTTEATNFKRKRGVLFPPFDVFLHFLENMADMKNDPGFQFERKERQKRNNRTNQEDNRNTKFSGNKNNSKPVVDTRKTEMSEPVDVCPVHKNSTHSLNECRVFRQKPIVERKKIILSSGMCFRCCSGKKHLAKNCKANVKCQLCQKVTHPTALHEEPSDQDQVNTSLKTIEVHEGEGSDKSAVIQSAYTKLRGLSKSCAKIIPVRVFRADTSCKPILAYAIIDDQSNRSLATSNLFDHFKDNRRDCPYTLVSCAGTFSTAGRFGKDYFVESLDGTTRLTIPELVECNDLPSNRDEIPTRQVALAYPHMKHIASQISPLIESANIEILIGRDVLSAHVVEDQLTGNRGEPFAQKLALGWVIVGSTCLDGVHVPEVHVFKTYALRNGRPSTFEPCASVMLIHDGLFTKTENDEKVGLSMEDREFLKIMESSFTKDATGRWVAPLPFKAECPVLPDNRSQALRRARSFDTNLLHNHDKAAHVKEFMTKLFDRGHAEKAPDLNQNAGRWFLPMFAVYHPKKPGSVRVVFDSSARFDGISLNDALMKGPDLTNSLQGVLMRFRQEQYAVLGDIEQMFHNFHVREDHRDYLRFLWHPNHDLQAPLEEYRMTVHVFGNSPSPAVATFGLRRSVQTADPDVQDFVSHNFYVDDGLASFSCPEKAVDLIKRTQQALYDGGRLRLHKIASNSLEVLQQFPEEDLSKDLAGIDLMQEDLPEQRSLGIIWNIEEDTFRFRVNKELKPFTRRGVLSTVNSLFDPIGFTAPVVIVGRILMRDAMTMKCDWDTPLSEEFQQDWTRWVESLHALEDMHIPRIYCSLSVERASRLEVHIFCDASKEAVAAVGYLKVFHGDCVEVGFLLGKAKVAPTHGHTIPRLELCASVLAIELAEIIKEQLDISKDMFTFYSDSQVVLGYISNDSRRFHVYVSNRVSRVRSFCGPDSWRYIASDDNPADVATRGASARELLGSSWLLGPAFLWNDDLPSDKSIEFDLMDPESDAEVRKEATCYKTDVIQNMTPWCKRFERFSTWRSLVRAISFLKGFLRKDPHGRDSVALKEDAEHFIIKQAQSDRYALEIQAIRDNKCPPPSSPLLSLNPVLDEDGILHIGGRIKHLMTQPLAQPIIIPKGHHVATLLVRYYHAKVYHQGRHMTEGSIRNAGFWIVGGKRLINTVIRTCIPCRKLRGKLGWTLMADLPPDRITPGPPFTFVGVDAFGPWHVVVRKTTRGTRTTCKHWAVLFTCLVSRAIHIELVDGMSSEAFINALRRFLAIRGPVQQFRSDRGTNFIGAMKELGVSTSFDESGAIHDFLSDKGATWVFNPPYAHHFGGAWERLIGSCRRILDAVLMESRPKDLTYDVLVTFMAEVSAIINSRPLLPVSCDPEAPTVLSPSMVFTQKIANCKVNMDVTGFQPKDAMRSQWKLVQHLADNFWRRWTQEYVHNLQPRKKWQIQGTVFKEGDLVLVKDDCANRCDWPIGIVEEVFPSKDEMVRKLKVAVVRDNVRTTYIRPISELVHLLDCE